MRSSAFLNPINQPEEFDCLPSEDRSRVLDWIGRSFAPSGSRNASPGISYGMKHWLEEDLGFYITNGAFKGAMLAAGYQPWDATALNWEFRCRWASQCHARVVAGHRCKRPCVPSHRYCWRHSFAARLGKIEEATAT